MSSVFVPPDIQTVTNAAAAALASENICAQIAAGLSSSPYAYMLDGVSPAAIMSAPKGLFTLNGAQVPLSSLLSFSSGQKYTVGPDGNYMLNAANGPAWDWSTGRRRLLVEAISATNYWLNSENAASWSGLSGITASVASNALFNTLALATLTATDTGAAVMAPSLTVGVGGVASLTIALVAGNKSTASLALYDTGANGWGIAGCATLTVISGPGAVSGNPYPGAFSISGLTSTPTVVRLTRTFPSATSGVQPILWVTSYAASTIGDTIKAGRPQSELGYGSSYIVSGASPTARAADVVTATSGLLALLNSAGASFSLAMRGKLTAPQRSSILGPGNRIASVLLYSEVYLDLTNHAGNGLLCAPGSGDLFTGDFGVAASSIVGGLIRKGAANGSAVVSDNYTLFDGSETSMVIGGGSINWPANMLLDELIVWPTFASDAGLQAQARVYS